MGCVCGAHQLDPRRRQACSPGKAAGGQPVQMLGQHPRRWYDSGSTMAATRRRATRAKLAGSAIHRRRSPLRPGPLSGARRSLKRCACQAQKPEPGSDKQGHSGAAAGGRGSSRRATLGACHSRRSPRPPPAAGSGSGAVQPLLPLLPVARVPPLMLRDLPKQAARRPLPPAPWLPSPLHAPWAARRRHLVSSWCWCAVPDSTPNRRAPPNQTPPQVNLTQGGSPASAGTTAPCPWTRAPAGCRRPRRRCGEERGFGCYFAGGAQGGRWGQANSASCSTPVAHTGHQRAPPGRSPVDDVAVQARRLQPLAQRAQHGLGVRDAAGGRGKGRGRASEGASFARRAGGACKLPHACGAHSAATRNQAGKRC